MRLSRLTLTGFRCFGTPTTVELDDLTALVGSNGVGKTAILAALVRMFGTTNMQRSLTKDDFYLLPSATRPIELHLVLDATFEFPELLDDNEAQDSSAVPECLRHIMLSADAEVPECRIMLKATWRHSASVEGDIEQRLVWVESTDLEPDEEALHHLQNVERSLIQVFYVPATRDAARELRAVSGTILSRALQRVAWSDSVRDLVREATEALTEVVRGEVALKDLEELLRSHWNALCDHKSNPLFAFAESDLPSVLRGLDTRLERADGTHESLALLSEGERSLMYFALVQSALEFERKASGSSSTLATAVSPVLTVIAVEEPENHLAPQYLGRILSSLRGAIGTGGAQVLITSHSASLMRRIEPTEIRHLRVDSPGVHHVSRLTLPSDADEAFKYVREAVRSHPELYFARAIVLCEGASEEVVLPRVARALDLDIDPRFVAVVPLGGRHVNHFWRLLRALHIPHATLLDLDVERAGGGWGRVHYVMRQLLEVGEKPADVHGLLTEEEFDALPRHEHPESADDDALMSWVDHLEERFNVFFSAPLDVDLLLFGAFEHEYKKLAPVGGGPRVPVKEPARSERLAASARAVLGAEGGDGSSYPASTRQRFSWYSYLFLGGSKPSAHAAVFAELDDAAVRASCPNVLARLVARLKVLTTT